MSSRINQGRNGAGRAAAEINAPPPGTGSLGKLERLTSAAFEGVLRLDATGRIRSANESACHLLGIPFPPPPGEIIGQTLLEATHLRAMENLCNEAILSGDASAEVSVRLISPLDRTLRARAVCLPKNSGVMLLLMDETEILHLRTIRSEFVANVSHELRTPLASIRAMAETLLTGAIHDAEAAPRFLETIIRESDRLVRLSEDLLNLSRAESKKREHSHFDLSALIQDVTARLLLKAERRNVTVTVAPIPPVVLFADRSELDQVFFNLIDNALKYTPGGGRVTITVTPHHSDTANEPGTVAIQVADTGIGILSRDLPRIFERFWRADRARRFQNGSEAEQSGGTGLGLSIVKHIVEAHEGTVTAESELGHGSRFTVTLPLPLKLADAEP